MTHRTPLALLFTSLLAGCLGEQVKTDDSAVDSECNNSCCGFEGGTFEADATYTIPEATYLDALADNESLSEEACERLCRDNHWLPEAIVEIRECRDDGQDESSNGLVYCRWEEEEYCEGRAHAGVERATCGEGPSPTAAWLARAARAEAGSAIAFSQLRAELLQHDAPDALLARCAAAARDEIAHARQVRRLAVTRGARVLPAAQVRFPPRDLEAIAVENAVEGCVGETWAALQAVHQARMAEDPQIRVAMARIAEDETRHAELARDLHAWFLSRLSPEAGARVEAARLEAWARLKRAAAEKAAGPEDLGLPSPEHAAWLLDGLAEAWAA
ncbi:MAG: ferritin-like domain-containing protein [Alphaproteobacteria bacterium]|nr:ferritin-like domain-containing protein [Alphaproteobacteria bacterium]